MATFTTSSAKFLIRKNRMMMLSTPSYARIAGRRVRSATTSTNVPPSATPPESSTSLLNRVPSAQALAFSAGGVGATWLTVQYAPFLKTTREGISVAWRWSDLATDEIMEVASAWVWQFWIGVAGLFGGIRATRATISKAIGRSGGSLLIPFKMPFLILGGVLGAKFTTSTAKPMAEFVILAGRLVEFTLDGLQADFMGKERHELAWVRRGVNNNNAKGQMQQEQVPYETRSGNVLRDLALVQCDINDPKACGPYRHKLLLVRELGALRHQERLIKQSVQEPSSKTKSLKEIEKEKLKLKKMCQDLYGFKIGRLYEEIESEAALKLEDLRAEQLTLVRQRAKLSDVYKVDREKAKLKAEAKLALGVKLSTLTRPSPKWKTVQREVSAAHATV